MNKPPALCRFCFGTSNALTRLVMLDGKETLVDPKRKDPKQYRQCMVCNGTGLTTKLNDELVELVLDLADATPEFLPDQDADGVPVDNPEFDLDEFVDHCERLVQRAREIRDRFAIPATE